ncbi:CRE-SRH-56 protein [Caenorhabditis remanei]|uniref:CRE-SRH-56 protein n=1 Tax=Caenorhabditis remanei TaxID=31234 RepID=E3LLG9_CAERE|nr:CRE-SRH-56 protein [Caenorhabditis remanei]
MEWLDYNESKCRENYTYFGSADYLRNAYHLTAFLTIPLSLFTFYTIIKVTPKRMRSMKIPLLIAHAWSTNLDLMFTVYSAPYIFFPSASGVPLGLLGAVGVGVKWQSYWGQVSVTMMGVNFIMLFENRQSQITTIKLKIKKKRTRLIYFTLNYLFAFIVMLPFYLDNTDQIEMRKIVLARIPCPTIEFFDTKTYVLLKGGEVIPFWSITIGFSFVILQSFFFLFHTIYHLTIISSAKVSEATKNLQKKFLSSVSLQISIPWVAIAFPVAYSMYADKMNYYNQGKTKSGIEMCRVLDQKVQPFDIQIPINKFSLVSAYNNNAMLIMANHGLLSTCCTLFIYKPYRDFVKQVLTGQKEDRRQSITVGTVASRIGSISN